MQHTLSSSINFETSEYSYNFVVDIGIEKEYYYIYRHLPLFPINRVVEDTELWDYQKELIKTLNNYEHDK